MKDKSKTGKPLKVVNDSTFFKSKRKPKNDEHCTQNVEVNVNVQVNEKQDDCLTGCFKSLFKCGMTAAEGA